MKAEQKTLGHGVISITFLLLDKLDYIKLNILLTGTCMVVLNH